MQLEGREPADPGEGIGARCLLRRYHAGSLFVGCIVWCDSARVVAAAREDKSPAMSRRGTFAVQDVVRQGFISASHFAPREPWKTAVKSGF